MIHAIKTPKRKFREVPKTSNIYLCPMCGAASLIKEKSFYKHLTTKACCEIQQRDMSLRSSILTRLLFHNPPKLNFFGDTVTRGLFTYDKVMIANLSALTNAANLPSCSNLIDAGQRYGYMYEYVRKRSFSVNFSVSTFLLDVSRKGYHPGYSIAVDTPSGSLMDAVNLSVRTYCI